MKLGKGLKYDYTMDDELKERIIENYGFLNKEQYLFSKAIIKEMIEREMKSNEDLVKLTGLAKSTISNYVNGKQIARANELKILSKKLMLPTDTLLGKSKSRTIKAIQVENMLGQSENAMKVFYELKHNIAEVKDLNDKLPISSVNQTKLEVFSLFVENKANFEMLLTYFESYVMTKQKLGEEIENNISKEDLDVLIVRISKLVFNNLDNIANNYRRE